MKFRQLDMENPKAFACALCLQLCWELGFGIVECLRDLACWVEEDYWLVLPEGTPLEPQPRLTQRAVEGLQKELRRRATARAQWVAGGALKEGAAIGGPEVPVVTEPQVEAWQKVWKIQSMNRMRSDVLKLLGFGSKGDVLAYQTARAVAPELAILDPIVGGLTLLLVAHQAD
eukprot:Skav210309  [mRNA]  locus=scaffold475:226375:230274:- [translate_table: standard]